MLQFAKPAVRALKTYALDQQINLVRKLSNGHAANFDQSRAYRLIGHVEMRGYNQPGAKGARHHAGTDFAA
jgi:hypothetical protein